MADAEGSEIVVVPGYFDVNSLYRELLDARGPDSEWTISIRRPRQRFRATDPAMLVAIVGAAGSALTALVTGILQVISTKGGQRVTIENTVGRSDRRPRVHVPTGNRTAPQKHLGEAVENTAAQGLNMPTTEDALEAGMEQCVGGNVVGCLRTLLGVLPEQIESDSRSDHLLDGLIAILPQRLTTVGGISAESLCLQLLDRIASAPVTDPLLRGLTVALLHGVRGPLHESELSPALLSQARSIARGDDEWDVDQIFLPTLVGESLGSLAWLIRPPALPGRPGNSVIRLLCTTARPRWGTYGESERGAWFEHALAGYASADRNYSFDDLAKWRSVVHLDFHAIDTYYRLGVLDRSQARITEALQKLHELARLARKTGLREEDTFLSARLAKLAGDLPMNWELEPFERLMEALAVVHLNDNPATAQLADLVNIAAPVTAQGIDDQEVNRAIQLIWDAVRAAYGSLAEEMPASSRWRAAVSLLDTIEMVPTYSLFDASRWEQPELWTKALVPLFYAHPFDWRPITWHPEQIRSLSPVVTCGEQYAWNLASGNPLNVTKLSRSIWSELWQLPPSQGIWMVGPDGIRDEYFGDDPEAIRMAGLYPTIRAHSQAIRHAVGEDEIDLDAIDRINEVFTQELSRKIDSTHELIAASGLSIASDDLVCSIGSLSQFPWEKSIDRVSTHAHACLEPGSADAARVLIDDPVLDHANVAIIGDDPDLAMAVEEIEALRAAYGTRSKIITGTTLVAIEDAAKVASILHITAHGDQAWRDPRENFLRFAKHQMTAKEVAELNLDRVNLVVVNSCNAGALGINMNAGDATLAGAFIAAGAKAVIVALWEVEGSCAATFSAQLYASLSVGMRVTDAFDQATQALRSFTASMADGSSTFYSDPFRLILRARGVPLP